MAFNISPEQIAYARQRSIDEDLTDRVQFVEEDYRNIQGDCDVFVSVGMLEHVGLTDYRTLGGVIGRVLTDRGRGFLPFIGRNQPAPLNPWIRKRIFPGAYPPTLREVFERVLEPEDLAVLDVENLRLHYGKTLEHWRQRFSDAAPRVAGMFDETFVRAWGCTGGFSSGLHDRIDATLPGGVRTRRQQRDSVDARRLIVLMQLSSRLRVFVAAFDQQHTWIPATS